MNRRRRIVPLVSGVVGGVVFMYGILAVAQKLRIDLGSPPIASIFEGAIIGAGLLLIFLAGAANVRFLRYEDAEEFNVAAPAEAVFAALADPVGRSSTEVRSIEPQ